jgi:hypothetical protein
MISVRNFFHQMKEDQKKIEFWLRFYYKKKTILFINKIYVKLCLLMYAK